MKILSIITITAGLLLSMACTTSHPAPEVEVRSVELKLTDTATIAKQHGEQLLIIADVEVALPHPVSASDTAMQRLQRVFKTFVLQQPDSVAIDDAVHALVANTLHQNDEAPDGEASLADIELEDDGISEHRTSISISPIKQERNLLTYCRVDVVKKDDVVTGVSHRYYTIDLETMQAVTLRSLFNEEALPFIAQMLRERLLSLNNVTTGDQLSDLGYFNADNLRVTKNFYITGDGVTWSYLPGELAVGAVGEPTITIEPEYLSGMLAPQSPLLRYYEN